MQIFKIAKEKPKVVLIQGSPRSKNSCPDMISKTSKIIDFLKTEFSDKAEIDLIDLSVEKGKPNVQPCKSCYSSAGGYHCHFPCDCYSEKSDNKDLLFEENVFDRILLADAFFVVTPIHWYSVTTPVKSFFDRLICCNLTLKVSDAKRILGDGIKDSKITGALNESKKFNELLINHYAGKFAGFFAHGDNGADDYMNKEVPDSLIEKDESGITNDPKQSVMPLVLQCRYSGIFVPSDCIDGVHINKEISYYEANSAKNDVLNEKAASVFSNLLNHLE